VSPRPLVRLPRPLPPRRPAAPRRDAAQAGFSIIELMVALVLLGLGILSLANLFPLGSQTQLRDRLRTSATDLAQQKMEQLRMRAWSDTDLDVGTHPDADGETLTLAEEGEFVRYWIVEAQTGSGHVWYFIPQFVGFVIFLVSGFAETNRPPFDLPEADAELVQGYVTEYGGGRFAAFYAAEYVNIIVVSALTATLFLGGWNVPFVDPPTWVDPIVVILKTLALVFFFIWIRATLPRLRYDQLMRFGWKVLLPIATVNALVTALLVVLV